MVFITSAWTRYCHGMLDTSIIHRYSTHTHIIHSTPSYTYPSHLFHYLLIIFFYSNNIQLLKREYHLFVTPPPNKNYKMISLSLLIKCVNRCFHDEKNLFSALLSFSFITFFSCSFDLFFIVLCFL